MQDPTAAIRAADAAVERTESALQEAQAEYERRAAELGAAEEAQKQLLARERDLHARAAELGAAYRQERGRLLDALIEGRAIDRAALERLKADLSIYAEAIEHAARVKRPVLERAVLEAQVEEAMAAAEVVRARLEHQRAVTARAALALIGAEGTVEVRVRNGRTDELVLELERARERASEALERLEVFERRMEAMKGAL